jgi:hypothetical protein
MHAGDKGLSIKIFSMLGPSMANKIQPLQEEVMFKKLLLIGVLCLSLMAMVGTDAGATWFQDGLGFGGWSWSPPSYHMISYYKGGGPTKWSDANQTVTLEMLVGDLALYNPDFLHKNQPKVVFTGVGGKIPVYINAADFSAVKIDETGKFFIDQPWGGLSVEDCNYWDSDEGDWRYPSCGGRSDGSWNTDPRNTTGDTSYCYKHTHPEECAFMEYIGLYDTETDPNLPDDLPPPEGFSDYLGPYVKNNWLPQGVRGVIFKFTSTLAGDFTVPGELWAIYATDEDPRGTLSESFPGTDNVITYIASYTEGQPWAFNDPDYTATEGKRISISGCGVLCNDFDYVPPLTEGEPGSTTNDNLTVYSVNGVAADVGIEIITDAGGKLTLDADGTFVYRAPSVDTITLDSFYYANTDDDEKVSNEAYVVITVNPK